MKESRRDPAQCSQQVLPATTSGSLNSVRLSAVAHFQTLAATWRGPRAFQRSPSCRCSDLWLRSYLAFLRELYVPGGSIPRRSQISCRVSAAALSAQRCPGSQTPTKQRRFNRQLKREALRRTHSLRRIVPENQGWAG